MSKKLTARGLAEVKAVEGNKPYTTILVLTDTANTSTGFIINPEGLNALLELGLGLAVEWADQPELEVENLTGAQAALPAQRILLARGRNDKECALRVFVGKIELTFLIPLDNVISAINDLSKQLDLDIIQHHDDSVN